MTTVAKNSKWNFMLRLRTIGGGVFNLFTMDQSSNLILSRRMSQNILSQHQYCLIQLCLLYSSVRFAIHGYCLYTQNDYIFTPESMLYSRMTSILLRNYHILLASMCYQVHTVNLIYCFFEDPDKNTREFLMAGYRIQQVMAEQKLTLFVTLFKSSTSQFYTKTERIIQQLYLEFKPSIKRRDCDNCLQIYRQLQISFWMSMMISSVLILSLNFICYIFFEMDFNDSIVSFFFNVTLWLLTLTFIGVWIAHFATHFTIAYLIRLIYPWKAFEKTLRRLNTRIITKQCSPGKLFNKLIVGRKRFGNTLAIYTEFNSRNISRVFTLSAGSSLFAATILVFFTANDKDLSNFERIWFVLIIVCTILIMCMTVSFLNFNAEGLYKPKDAFQSSQIILSKQVSAINHQRLPRGYVLRSLISASLFMEIISTRKRFCFRLSYVAKIHSKTLFTFIPIYNGFCFFYYSNYVR